MFHMQPFSRVSPAILQLIGNPTHNGKNTWNSFTPVVDIGAGSSRSSLSCTICDDMMCWCFRTCAYNSWNWHDLVSTIPLVHRFVLHFTCWPLENTFLVTDTFFVGCFFSEKNTCLTLGTLPAKIWKLSMRFQAISAKAADLVIMRQVWTTHLWSISVSAATKAQMSHIMSKFQAKQSRLILYPNKSSPVFLIQSQLVHFDPVNQQLNISPFYEMKFVSSKPDVSITWSNPLHLDVSAENGVFFGKKPLTLSALRGKTPSCFCLQQLHGPFHQDLPAVIIPVQRCKNVCDEM